MSWRVSASLCDFAGRGVVHSVSRAVESSRIVRGTLGPLEQQVMEIVWREKQCSVRDVVERLPNPRAYTTVMTTLSRLYRRGLLSRTGVDRKFLYSACVDRVELDYMLAQRVLSRLLEIQDRSQAPELVSLYILKNLFQHDPDLFDAMVKIVRSNRGAHQLSLSELDTVATQARGNGP